MIEITDITEQKNKSRRNLFVENKFYCGIELETLLKHNIKIGTEFEEEELENILIESESIVAFNKALKYLTKGLKSEFEILNYLKNKGFIDKVIDIVMEKLRQYNYINDEYVCESYVNFYKQKYGKNKIKQGLLLKKIDEETIDKFLNYCEDEEKVNKLIEKFLKNKTRDFKTKQKLINNLLYKGYSYDEVIKLVGENFND